MDDDATVRSLVEEALNTGSRPEDVCIDHPEHLEEVRRRLLRIRDLAGDLERVFFCSGGSEAIEAALKMARQYVVETGEPERRHFIGRKQSS